MRPLRPLHKRHHKVVIHIPHASALIPDSEAKSLVLGNDDLQAELLRLTDWHTDELYDLNDSAIRRVIFPVSRLVVDPERFCDDANESMAARVMGAIHTMTSDGKPLRHNLSQAERDRLLSTYYDPHHDALTEVVAESCRQSDGCLIIDAHSFPSRPLPCDPDQDPVRPDFCLGKDSSHTPSHLLNIARDVLEAQGWRVAINKPYAGAFVPMAFYHHDWRVSSIMIEINRSLYLDEQTGARLPCFGAFKNRFHACLRAILKADDESRFRAGKRNIVRPFVSRDAVRK